ncbi:MjaI family restriction endonuclease [Natronorubrum sp. DTA28]|uniref:MjaI family restriction endonuclease n=1 Tax=Natronorubrum sp. DTA28 TaxID=3447019 RepID=UPI003F87A3B0
MANDLQISKDERRRIAVGQELEYPRYTTKIMNLACHTAQATSRGSVGSLDEILKEFEAEYPDGTFEDWVDYYDERYNGEVKVQRAAKKTHDMVENMREAVDLITYGMVEQWVEDLILYKSYMGFDAREVIIPKLGNELQVGSRLANPEEMAEGISGYLGEQPIALRSAKHDEGPAMYNETDVPVIYYEETNSGGYRVEMKELSRTLDEFNRD